MGRKSRAVMRAFSLIRERNLLRSLRRIKPLCWQWHRSPRNAKTKEKHAKKDETTEPAKVMMLIKGRVSLLLTASVATPADRPSFTKKL